MFEAIVALAKPKQFLNDVDFFCISDNYWLGKTKPCLTYGLRGMAYFEVAVQCSTQDLHSGVLGGTVHEAMTDLIALLNTLVDSSTGKITIHGILDDVKSISDEEINLYKDIEFDLEEYKESCKVKGVSDKLLHKNKVDLLMSRWRYPSLSIHGIEGAFSDKGAKTVIPAKVVGKFSIRLVPDQKPEVIENIVKMHLHSEFDKVWFCLNLSCLSLFFRVEISFTDFNCCKFQSLILQIKLMLKWFTVPRHGYQIQNILTMKLQPRLLK